MAMEASQWLTALALVGILRTKFGSNISNRS